MISLSMGSVMDRKIGATYLLPHLSDLEQGSELENECMEIFEVDADPLPSSPPPPGCRRPYSFFQVFSIPDFAARCPELHQIRLPRSYPLGHRLPENSVVSVFEWSYFYNRGSVVFAFDQADSQLYHIATKNETPKRPFDAQDGYVATHDTLYYVGGSYSNHDVRKTREKAFYQLLDEANCITPLLLTDTERDQMLRTIFQIGQNQK